MLSSTKCQQCDLKRFFYLFKLASPKPYYCYLPCLNSVFYFRPMIEKVPWNKSILLLKNILQNKQILQLLKQKVFMTVIKNAKLDGLGEETMWSN